MTATQRTKEVDVGTDMTDYLKISLPGQNLFGEFRSLIQLNDLYAFLGNPCVGTAKQASETYYYHLGTHIELFLIL